MVGLLLRVDEPSISVRNVKSDVAAKAAFCEWLRQHGYTAARVCAAPADVRASKDGATWLFEIKFTRAATRCFGAATLTEWAAAADDPDHFRFVIAYQRNGTWSFDLYTPDEFMAFSSVPPFKIYFNVPLDGGVAPNRRERSRRIYLTKSRLRELTRQFQTLRDLQD